MSLKFSRGQAREYVRQMRIARGGEKHRASRKAIHSVAQAIALENTIKGQAHQATTARLGIVI